LAGGAKTFLDPWAQGTLATPLHTVDLSQYYENKNNYRFFLQNFVNYTKNTFVYIVIMTTFISPF